jgi:hypothetical protein
VIQIDEGFQTSYNYLGGTHPAPEESPRYLEAAIEKIYVETGVVTQLGEVYILAPHLCITIDPKLQGSKTPNHDENMRWQDCIPVLNVNTKDYPSTYEERVKVVKALGLSSANAIVKAFPITYK